MEDKNSTKEQFKKYLQTKKQATENLTKLEQKEILKMEEDAIIKKLMKRERYATDVDYRMKQQECARKSMQKRNQSKNNKQEPVEDYTEEQPTEETIQEEEYIPPARRFNHRTLV